MIKRRMGKLIALLCVVAAILCTCSCSLNSLSVDRVREIFPKAVKNTLAEDLYYWKENIVEGKTSKFRKCNLYAELDSNYHPILNENGDYANLIVDIQESINSKNVSSIQCGVSSSVSGKEKRSYLFKTAVAADEKTTMRTKAPMASKDYIKSEEFQSQYSLNTMIKELEFLTADDMDFDYNGANLEEKGHVIQLSFKVKDSYLERYKAENNIDSMFAGSTHIDLEMAYDRISSLIVYANENLDQGVNVETERYKLEIVYFGPIVTLPQYDKLGEDGQPVWKEA